MGHGRQRVRRWCSGSWVAAVALWSLSWGCQDATSESPDGSREDRQALAVPGLVAAYGFDEGSGTTAGDASGNGLNGTLSGQTWTMGRYGGALAFSNNYLTVPDSNLLDLTRGMTLSAWVYPTAALQRWPTVVMKEKPSQMAYVLYANSDMNRPSAFFVSGGVEHGVLGGSGLPLNTWTHLAATYDGAAFSLYVNGALVSSVAQTATMDVSTNELRIGGNRVWGEYFPGRIDEVRIYNRALTPAEILSDRDTPITPVTPDTTPPTVSLTAPGAGSTLSGLVTLTASASDNVGVSSVTFLVDGVPLGSADTSPPYAMSWNTTAAVNDTHTLTAVARDGAGNTTTTTGTQVLVNNVAATSPYPLKRIAGLRYLVGQDNQPFLLHGDSAWSLFVGISKEDVELYLEDRRQKGFNTVLANLIEHKFAANPPLNFYGASPFTGTLPSSTLADFTTPNEAYFAHVDWVLQKAAEKGIQVLLLPAYLGINGGSEGWYQELTANGAARLRTYGEFLGARYKDFPNIIWVQGGDYNPPASGKDLVRAIVTGIKSHDANHLHSVHCAPYTSALTHWSGESWLDVGNIYTYPANSNLPTMVQARALVEYQRASWLPFFLTESFYENEHATTTQVQLRQQAYEALLSGGMGQVFGSNPIWNFNNRPIFGTSVSWKTQLHARGSLDMVHVKALFSSRRWEKLVPDAAHTFLTAGLGTPGLDSAVAALAGDGSFGIAYLPSLRTVTIDMSRMSGPVTARWFDPTQGTQTTVSGSPFPNSGTRTFTPPGNNGTGTGDWVLVLER
ncbi:apiosidase-like domain-containing protein [Pyxidicoccus xibeiensis]|uniref:apiosidase-like domain-containing protein n=1 Tax=Pyxidicoccus xibeiensis TaxID=2906759 RepID=UPI0020A75FD6|nr:DUF4038 domain-containing protein [Pyxidicoccus xibeiensis]MCP3137603.1 DUF4038 domain-containing protein [Pyxidicoccus xibeiensis]